MVFKLIPIISMLFIYGITPNAQAESDDSDKLIWNLQLDLGLVSDPTELIGIKQKDTEDYLELALFLDLYYKGFFIQSNKNRTASNSFGAEVGYHLYEGSYYDVSILLKSYKAGFDENEIYTYSLDKEVVPELAGIDSRLNSTMQAVRYLSYTSNSLFWIDIANDLFSGDHQGWLLDTFYVYTYRYRNWDFNAGAGATYFSKKTNDYFYGVSEHESRPFRAEYSPSGGLIYTLEFSAQLPISSRWVFSTGIRVNHYSSNISGSPLVARDTVARLKMSVGYVF